MVEQFEKGEPPSETEIRDRLVEARAFRPEFLNRLDAIIPFSPLSKENLLEIFDLQLARLENLLAEKKINLQVDKAAKVFLVDKGYSPKFGARLLKRVIKKAKPPDAWLFHFSKSDYYCLKLAL